MARSRNGHLIKRGKKGIYYLQYRINGKLHSECLHTNIKAEAEAAREKIMIPIQKADQAEVLEQVELRIRKNKAEVIVLEEIKTPPTYISNSWACFMGSHNRPDSGPRTLAGYQSQHKQFVQWHQRNHPEIIEMRHVTMRVAEEYADYLNTLNFSASTYNQHLNALALIWSVLAKKAKIIENPWSWDKTTKSGIIRRSLSKEKQQRKKRALTPDELEKILGAATGDYHTLFMILLYTGQRLVDGLKLEWNQINFEKGVIHLTPQKTARRSAKSVYIPLLPQLRHELESKIKDGTYILPELVNIYDRDNGSAIAKAIKTIFESAGIETQISTDQGSITKVGAHSFRHSFVTIARSAGLPDPIIQKITGHSSLEMVDHYSHFTEEVIARLTSSLPQETAALTCATNPLSEIKQHISEITSRNWKQKKEFLLQMMEAYRENRT